MFVDVAQIFVKSGRGGNGIVSFRKEKYVPAGGPDGGDGGKGGSVVIVADSGMRTLMDFRYKRKYVASNGENGMKKKMAGRKADDLIIKVPIGTIIRDSKTNKVIADITSDKQRVVIAKGGKGGKGNPHFRSSTRQAPTFAEMGKEGEEKDIILELKALADVGLVGFPNVGKSTILSMTTKAKPKIANYHFTTIKPNLGVVEFIKGKSFIMADIPGLIEGAKDGVGLGHDFLRHVERTRLLVHVVDVSGLEGRDPYEDFLKINEELHGYNEKLASRKQIVAANKVDLLHDSTQFDEFKEKIEALGYEVFEISAVTGQGLEDLFKYVTEMIDQIEVEPLISEDEIYIEALDKEEEETIKYIQIDEETYEIQGEFIDRLLYSTDVENIDSVRRFQSILMKQGIFEKLKEMGIEDGDTVIFGELEFEYYA